MNKNALLTMAMVLIIAIFGVIGYKLAPVLQPNADLSIAATACTPDITPCSAVLPGGGRIELVIEPRPIRPLQTLKLSVTLRGFDADQVEIDFDGTEMKMGYNRPVLTRIDGQFKGQAMLPVCVTGSMEWAATVLVTREKKRIAIPFHFRVAGR